LPPTGPVGPLKSVSFSAEDTILLAAGSDNTARAWHTVYGGTRIVVRGERAWFGPGMMTGEARRLLSIGNDGVVRLFGQKGEALMELGKASVAAVSSDGSRALLGRDDGGLSLVDLEENTEIRHWSSGTAAVSALTFLPGGQRAATAGQGGVLRIWQVGTGRLRKEIRGEWKEVYKLAASPDGRTLLAAVGNPHYARLIDLESGRDVHLWEGGGNVTALAISPDGQRAATAILGNNGSGIVRLYDTAKGDRVHEWTLPGLVYDLAFAHDGRHLATANANSTAYIFRFPTSLPP
jgi:WD40 repeat protein